MGTALLAAGDYIFMQHLGTLVIATSLLAGIRDGSVLLMVSYGRAILASAVDELQRLNIVTEVVHFTYSTGTTA